MIKKEYLQPEVVIVHLTAEQTILTVSQNAVGPEIIWDGGESSFDGFFGS